MTQDIIKAGIASIQYGDNGIVKVTFPLGAEVVLEDMKKINEKIRKVGKGKKVVLLNDIKLIKSATQEARLFPSSKDVVDVTEAAAILIGSPVSRVIANFHLGFSKPPFPVRMFTSEEKAVEWLKGFVKDEEN